MNSKQFALLIIVAFIGGIIGNCISKGPDFFGKVYADGSEETGSEKELASIMDIRNKIETTQQNAGRYNKDIKRMITTKLLPERQYADALEAARNDIQGTDLNELREKVASLQAVNICLLNYMGESLAARERAERLSNRP